MGEKLAFDLVAPDRVVSSTQVDMVVVPGTDGDFGVLQGHSALISTLRPGAIEVHDNGSVVDRIFVPGGFAEVNEARLTILAEDAENFKDLSLDDVRQQLQNAQEDFVDATNDEDRLDAEKRVELLTAKVTLLS